MLNLKTIPEAATLRAAARAYRAQYEEFERDVIQPFVDEASAECVMLAQYGEFDWKSKYYAVDEDKLDWFRSKIAEIFQSRGYTVRFMHHEGTFNISVMLMWD